MTPLTQAEMSWTQDSAQVTRFSHWTLRQQRYLTAVDALQQKSKSVSKSDETHMGDAKKKSRQTISLREGIRKTDFLRSGWPQALTPPPYGQLFVKFFGVFRLCVIIDYMCSETYFTQEKNHFHPITGIPNSSSQFAAALSQNGRIAV